MTMNIGMLWFDNDPKTELALKIERAVGYYREKYGRSPTLCFVHPSMIAKTSAPAPETEAETEIPLRAAGVEVRSSRSVLPNHFWLGVNATVIAG
jgi:hypothetical protein